MQYDKDLASEQKDLFLAARAFLLSFEGITETKKERITTYGNEKGGICHMRTMPHGIDFGFLKGAKMEEILDKSVVKYYLEQAIAINAKK